MKPLAGKRITVAGLGTHGGALGNVRWLAEQGAHVTVTDLKTEAELEKSLATLKDLPDIQWVLGRHDVANFTNTDIVLRNPAMPRDSEFLQAARSAGVAIEMDSSLFFKLSPTKNIIGVTGSKGKTSATHALSHLLSLVYGRVVTIGVEDTSPLPALDTVAQGDLVIFELSSWRLEALQDIHLSPATAVVTSLYRDHLNTYDSFEDYIETKKTIVRYQGVDDRAVLNFDDALVREWADACESRLHWFSLGEDIPGDGICVRHGIITVQTERSLVQLFPLDTIPSTSEHGRRNILPALYLAFCAGARIDTLRLALERLDGLAHRLETVRVVNGVTYVNDSAATIPDATMAALKAYRHQPVVLILGGSDKKLKFEELAQYMTGTHVRACIFLPGTATGDMRREIEAVYRTPPSFFTATTMPDAVSLATEAAQQGDIVLLSPGATSFGHFQHEFDRGEQFRAAVNAL